ncbi:MAG: FtsX-like permease family protein [Bacteroidales bacterium]|nr:FtsX-like permease family protein [Bacteroidales bacterium]MDY6406417.1 FtsX-like permease family protein [Bacteroidales bacterium]
MNFSLIESHIAWRYLFSKKGHNAINIVSGISAAAVVVVTAAMICVLSVMNGFGSLVEQMFSEFDPPLLVVPAEGQTLRTDTAPVVSLYAREDIQAVSMQLEQTALVRYKDHQLPARVLGVDTLFEATANMRNIITDGFFSVWDGAFDRATLGQGLAAQLGMNAHFTGALHLYAPQRTGRINMLRPDKSLQHEHAFIAGTFAVNQIEYDDQLILVSLPLAQRLFEYDEYTATALRIAPKKGQKIDKVQNEIAKVLGPGYKVLNRYEQQADFFRILRIEKWLTILLLVFILLIASFNIIGSLSMLIIDKREDIRILSDLGADEPTIRRIFLLEGWFISALGTLLGIIIGVLICLGQQHFGWLKLGTGSEYIISVYPVQVQIADILLVAAVVLALGFVAAWYPSRKLKVLPCLLCLLLVACTPNKPSSYRGLPQQYITAYEQIYGHCYDSVPYAVVGLDIYSDGLTLDEERRIKGTGYNLCITDIFVSDSLLEEGTYRSLPYTEQGIADPQPFTFLPGRDFEGYPHGMYILNIEEDQVLSIQVLDSGSFVYRNDSLALTLYFRNTYGSRVTYKCYFTGPLLPWLKQ